MSLAALDPRYTAVLAPDTRAHPRKTICPMSQPCATSFGSLNSNFHRSSANTNHTNNHTRRSFQTHAHARTAHARGLVCPASWLEQLCVTRDWRLRLVSRYKIVVTNEQLYTMCVHGFLRDIAQDNDYEIYAVNNWWDDLEKFGAVNARFLAVRHGLRFELTLHTTSSWDAFTTHTEYMRRKFDTVIKTDVLYGADTGKVQQAKDDMRREEMWRERWARIHVPDRALSKS
jgi:hypothetical protein